MKFVSMLLLLVLCSFYAFSQNLDPKDDLGSKLLDAAKNKNTAEVVKLIKAGADVNYTSTPEGPSALSYAAYNCDLEMIPRLIQSKANVNYATCSKGIRCQNNSTSLVYALAGSINTPALCSEAVSLLLAAKADVSYKSIFTNRTPLEIYSASAVVDFEIFKKISTSTLASPNFSKEEKQLILNRALTNIVFFSHNPIITDYLLTTAGAKPKLSSTDDDSDLLKLTMISSGVSASATKDIVQILNLLVKKGGLKVEEKHLSYSLDVSFPDFALAELQTLISLGGACTERLLTEAINSYHFNLSFTQSAEDQKNFYTIINTVMDHIPNFEVNSFIYKTILSNYSHLKKSAKAIELLVKHRTFDAKSKETKESLCYAKDADLLDVAKALEGAGVICLSK